MKRALLGFVLAGLLAPPAVLAQVGGGPGVGGGTALVTYAAANPSGTCAIRSLWWNTTSDHLWICEGTWIDLVAAGSSAFNGTFTIAGATNTTPALALSDLTANDFLKFTNVAQPTKIVVFSQNSSTPTLLMGITIGSLTSYVELANGSNTLHSFDGVNKAATRSVDLSGSPITTEQVQDVTGTVVSSFRVRGFQLPYSAAVASAGTIAPRANVFHVTGAVQIDTITVASAGTCIVMIFDSTPIVSETGNIKLSAAFTASADDTLSLCHDGTTWFETARSVN